MQIKCQKYNYNVDSKVQNFDKQHSYIEISKDGEELNIYNLNMQEKVLYVLEADPNVVAQERLKRKQERKKIMKLR